MTGSRPAPQELDRSIGELLARLADDTCRNDMSIPLTDVLGPARRFVLAGRTAHDVIFGYHHAIERALSGTGATRRLWTAVARHHGRTIQQFSSAVAERPAPGQNGQR